MCLGMATKISKEHSQGFRCTQRFWKIPCNTSSLLLTEAGHLQKPEPPKDRNKWVKAQEHKAHLPRRKWLRHRKHGESSGTKVAALPRRCCLGGPNRGDIKLPTKHLSHHALKASWEAHKATGSYWHFGNSSSGNVGY